MSLKSLGFKPWHAQRQMWLLCTLNISVKKLKLTVILLWDYKGIFEEWQSGYAFKNSSIRFFGHLGPHESDSLQADKERAAGVTQI